MLMLCNSVLGLELRWANISVVVRHPVPANDACAAPRTTVEGGLCNVIGDSDSNMSQRESERDMS